MGYFLLPPTIMKYDKQKHALLGAFLSIFYIMLKHNFGVSELASILFTLLAVLLISYAIEFIQLFKPNRVFSHADVAATLFGSIIGLLIILTLN